MKKFLLLISIMFYVCTVHAYDFYIGDIYYSYNSSDQSLTVVSASPGDTDNCYKGRGSMFIPDTVECNGRKLPVKRIGDKAFWNCNDLRSIVLPSCLTYIGQEAFAFCTSLKSVDFPQLNSIGYRAFYYSGLTQLTLPCKGIGREAFLCCNDLSYVKLVETTGIGEAAFRICKSIKTFILPGTLNTIGKQAFAGCDSVEVFTLEDGESRIKYDTYTDSPFYGSLMKPKYVYIGRLRYYAYGDGDPHSSYEFSIQDSAVLTIGKYVVGLYDDSGFNFSSNYFQKVYVMNEEPTQIGVRFNNNTFINGTLYVPIGSKDKYMNAKGWKNFFKIVEMNIDDMWDGQGVIPDDPNPDPNPDPNYLKCDVNGDGEVNIADINTIVEAILSH